MNLKKKRIGILGGSFDPAHNGHLAISKEAVKRFKLEKIIWAITKKNPFKIKSSLSLQSRIKGCKKIIKKNKFIEVKFYENKIKSNKTISFRVLAQIASAVPKRVKFDKVELISSSDYESLSKKSFDLSEVYDSLCDTCSSKFNKDAYTHKLFKKELKHIKLRCSNYIPWAIPNKIISENIPNSLILLAINCVNCEPKSTIKILFRF